MNDMANQLDAVNTEIARQLAECEDRLRTIAQEFGAWKQTSLFSVLDQATKVQVENAVRAYITSNTERIRIAKAGFDALRSIGAQPSAPMAQDPLAELSTPRSQPAAPQSPPPPVERLGNPEDSLSRRLPQNDPGDDEFVNLEDMDEPEPSATREATPAPSPVEAPLPGASEGRPRPKRSRGSAAPVKDRGGISRAPGPDPEGAPVGGRTIRATRHSGGATVRPVSQGEMISGERDDGVVVGPPGDDLITSGRSLNPNADFDAAARTVRERQREHLAAKKAEDASGSAALVMKEAEILDVNESMIGRAIGIRRHDKQMVVDQVELYLESMEEDWGDSEASSILRSITRSRRKLVFQGAQKKVEAIVAYANVCGFDETDDSVLILRDVGLAAVPARAAAR